MSNSCQSKQENFKNLTLSISAKNFIDIIEELPAKLAISNNRNLVI